MKNFNEIYSNNELISFRVKSLIKNGWLFEDKFLKCTKKSKILITINLLFQKIYKLEITG